MSGIFLVNREIFENNIWNNVAEFRLFFYILGQAIWKDEGVYKGTVFVGRGQYLRSYRKLREDLMYIENNAVKYYGIATIKRLIDKLVQDERLEITETELGTLFTVLNYSSYQTFNQFNQEDSEQQRNSNGTATEQQRNNKKKVKKVNNDIYSAFFENVWSKYPNKKGKGKISESKKKEIFKLGDEFTRCINRYTKDVESERQNGFKELKYQNGSTFFNSGYVDYLDDNYQPKEQQPKRWTIGSDRLL